MFKELWRRLKDKAAVVYPHEDFDYGMREFAIRDNNATSSNRSRNRMISSVPLCALCGELFCISPPCTEEVYNRDS